MESITKLFPLKTSTVPESERIKHDSPLRKLLLLGLGGVLVLHAFLVVIVFIGAELERRHVIAASPTGWMYITPKVCATPLVMTDGEEDDHANTAGTSAPVLDFITYHSHSEANADNAHVAHCGECGQCSSLHDIDIIKSTTKTLTKDSTSCATVGLLTGLNRNSIARCMEFRVGFTESCRNCWVDNIVCTLSKCKYSCMKSVFILNESVNVNGSRKLNPCLECDEKLCGPRFLECAGANRRRIGVYSDIEREGVEVCAMVDVKWMATS